MVFSDTNNFNTESNTPSEFQPFMEEFRRISELVLYASECSVSIRAGEDSYLHNYYAVLFELYINIRPFMYENFSKIWDGRIDNIKILYNNWSIDVINGYTESPTDLIDELQLLHRDLLDVKQKALGLGLPVYHSKSTRSKMKAGLLGKA
jgi:hypothetical protein